MKKEFLAGAAAILLLPGALRALDETKEPALTYFLEIGKDTYETTLGEKIAVKGTLTDPVLKLRAADSRLFEYGGVSFKYPAYFTWEAEVEGDEYKSWTLSGNDFKITHFNSSGMLDAARYEAQVLGQVKGQSLGPVERKLGGKLLKGRKFSMTIGGHTITHEAYAVEIPSSKALLVFQDSPSEKGGLSMEGQKAIALLEETFRSKGQ